MNEKNTIAECKSATSSQLAPKPDQAPTVSLSMSQIIEAKLARLRMEREKSKKLITTDTNTVMSLEPVATTAPETEAIVDH